MRSEEHTSELQSHLNLVCRLLLEKKKNKTLSTALLSTVSRLLSSLLGAWLCRSLCSVLFFFNDTATTEIYTLSLHDALPICGPSRSSAPPASRSPPLPARASSAATAARSRVRCSAACRARP